MAPNVIIHGAVYVDGEKTSYGKTSTVSKRSEKEKRAPSISVQIKQKKLRDARIYENIQNQISERIKCSYHSKSSQQLSLSNHYSAEGFIISSHKTFSYFTGFPPFTALKILLYQQKFYSFLFFTMISRLPDSFLRGPPLFC